MPKRTRTPTQTCPHCGTRIVYLLQGTRTRACDLERYTVLTAQGVTAVGWRRHKCPQAPSTLKNLIDTQKTTLGTMPQGEEKP